MRAPTLAIAIVSAVGCGVVGGIAAVAPASAEALSESIYAVRLNGANVSDGAVFLLDTTGHLYADEKDLRSWRLRIGERVVRITRKDGTFVRLDSVGKIAVTIDADQQLLILTAPPELFEEATVSAQRLAIDTKPEYHRGAFLNYDTHARIDTVGPSDVSTALEAGVNVGSGVLVDTEVVNMHPGGVERLATTWQSDDIARDRSTQIGDAFASDATIGGNVRFAGIRVASNYSSRQDTTSPQASVLGTASLPSTVDVYVNNVLALTQNVDPGVFRIENLPQIDGQGNVQLVVHDALGREQTITRSYYGAASLLRAGLDEYEYAAGIARDDYGESNAYGTPMFSATERHGFTDRFTGEVHAEGSDRLAQASLDGSWLVPTIGDLTFGIGVAKSPSGTGAEVLVGDSYSSDRANYGISLRLRTSEYSDLGTATGGNETGTLAGHVGFHLTRRSSIGLTYAETTTAGGSAQRVFTTDFGGSIGGMQVALNAVNPLGGGSRYLSLNILTLIGRNSISANQTVQNGSSSPGLSIQHNAIDTYGASYAVTGNGGPAPYFDTRVSGAQPVFDYQAGFATDGREEQTDLDFKGAIASVDGHAYVSRAITQSYGVAEIDGVAGVPVYVNNQIVGYTNSDGRVLVPNMQSYHANTVSIDPQTLPLSANVGETRVYAAPYYRSPSVIRFKSNGDGGVTVELFESDGTVVPAGSVVIGPDKTEWPVADHGETYIGGLTAGAPVTLSVKRLNGSFCNIVLNIPIDTSSVPTLKPVTCGANAVSTNVADTHQAETMAIVGNDTTPPAEADASTNGPQM